jgi:hypothetical protein
MPVILTDGDVQELRRLLHGLYKNPFEQGEITAMGGLRSVLSRDLLAKLCVQVPESKMAEALYKPAPVKTETLTIAQERGTALVEENRRLKERLGWSRT